MPSLGPMEIVLIILVIAILFGWSKLPDAARSLGRSMRIFKSEVEEMKRDKPSEASRDTVPGRTVPPAQAAQTPQHEAPAPTQPQAQSQSHPQPQQQYEPPAHGQSPHQPPQSGSPAYPADPAAPPAT